MRAQRTMTAMSRPIPPRSPSCAAFFVTGTGTGVGKTHVSSQLLSAARRKGLTALGLKPIETGTTGPADPGGDAAALAQAAGHPPGVGAVYSLRLAASPHLAAAAEGLVLDEGRVLAALRPLLDPSATSGPGAEVVLVEGAGGLRVPLRPGYEMIDLCRDLGLPVLLVARAGLGTLNETLLSLEALQRRGIPLLGTVLSEARPGEDPLVLRDNLLYLGAHAPGGVLGWLRHGASLQDPGEGRVDVDDVLARASRPRPAV